MSQSPPKRALGRGLSALLPQLPSVEQAASATSAERRFFNAPIEEVYPNPDQPRKSFAKDELHELAQSIKTYGIIQPLAVRRRKPAGYWLIAGERRWRAAQRAGKERVPVVVHDIDGSESLERALVENLQRADLNPLETARAYAHIMDQLDCTQEELGERVGKDRSSIANMLRLLKLPASVQKLVANGTLSMGHARALLGAEQVSDMEIIAHTIARKNLSVRATEKLIKEGSNAENRLCSLAKLPKKLLLFAT